MNILEIHTEKNTWMPPGIDEYAMAESMAQDVNAKQGEGFVYVFRTQPYIDSVYVRYDENRKPVEIKRFTFHEGYIWSNKEERVFDEYCVNNKNCTYNGGAMDEIFTYYSKLHPEWHLKRYYTKGIRLLDHIYHCMKKNTAKELLYKSGLDELAVGVYQRKDLNLLASNPSEIYDGLSMKVLRSMNCEYGAMLLNNEKRKAYIKDLDVTFPNLLKTKLLSIFPQALVISSICPATHERQDALKELCSLVQGLIVIGGRSSANTNRLFKTAQALCQKAVLIEKPEEIPEEFFSLESVGITAGASTPDDTITAVEELLEKEGKVI